MSDTERGRTGWESERERERKLHRENTERMGATKLERERERARIASSHSEKSILSDKTVG